MDEKGIGHKQAASAAKKARKMAEGTFLAGAASGRPGVMGAGVLASRTELSSDFSRVRRIRPFPRLHLIKVDARFSHNQVYVPAEDFPFVLDFIRTHCPHPPKQGLWCLGGANQRRSCRKVDRSASTRRRRKE